MNRGQQRRISVFNCLLLTITASMLSTCETDESEDSFTVDNAPSNLTVELETNMIVRLSWQDNSGFEEGFKIDRRIGSDEWQIAYGITGENVEIWRDSVAIPDSINRYRLYGFAGDQVSLSLEGELTPSFPAPTALELQALTPVVVQLSWQANCDIEDGYRIDKRTGSEEWQVSYGTVGPDTEIWNDTLTVFDACVGFRVYAYVGSVVSGSLTVYHIPEFPPPADLQAVEVSDTEIVLSWQDNSTGEDGFKIDRRIGGDTWQIEYAVVEAETEIWHDTDAVPGVVHYYQLYGYAGDLTTEVISTSVRYSPPELWFLPNSVETGLDTLFTFPRKTFFWAAYNPDEGEAIARFEWTLEDTTEWEILPPESSSLCLDDSHLNAGEHRFWLRALDSGGAYSETLCFPTLPDSGETGMVWMVMTADAELLIVDDENYRFFDTDREFYCDLFDQMGQDYQLWDVAESLPYSEDDVLATLQFFPRVFWFSGPISQLHQVDTALQEYMNSQHGLIVASMDLGEGYTNNPPFTFTHIDTMLNDRRRISASYDLNPLWAGMPVLRPTSIFSNTEDAHFGFLPDSNCAVIYDQEAYGTNPQVNLAVRYPDTGRPHLFAFQLPLHLCDEYGNLDSLFMRMFEEFDQ